MQYSSSNFKRNGAQFLVDNITQALVVIGTTKGDSFAAHQAASIAVSPMAGADVALTDSGDDLLISVNGKTGIDPSGTAADTDDVGIALCSATEVILVVDANDRTLTNADGDTIDIPALQHFIRESTSI